MRHVDDGTIHAWLDDQIDDPAERTRVDEHFRTCAECRGRAAAERITRDDAEALLAVATPATSRPPFADLARQAGAAMEAETREPAGRSWLLQGAWAASLVLAIGIGWLARDFAGREAITRAGNEAAPAADARQFSAPAADAIASPSSTPPGEAAAGEASRSTPGRRLAAPAAPPVGDVRGAGASSAAANPEGPAISSLQRIERAAEPSGAATDAAPPLAVSTPSSASAGIGDSADRELVTITGATPLVVPAPPRQELVTIIGAAGGAQAFAQSAAWQSVPRTEAAARSGMALYGIEGLDPLQTMIPADGAIVRTTYRLESGELVQLEQRRSALTDRVPASLQETVRARPAAPAAQSTVDTDADGTRTWSAVLGAARLTLRASSPSANLEMLAQRLRVD